MSVNASTLDLPWHQPGLDPLLNKQLTAWAHHHTTTTTHILCSLQVLHSHFYLKKKKIKRGNKKFLLTALSPRRLFGTEEVTPDRIAVATTAPRHWAMMYMSALKMLIWQLSRRPRVTAGFRWAPLMWPTLCAMVAMDNPKASETFTLSWDLVDVLLPTTGKLIPRAEPMLIKIKRLMARNSATTALQNIFFLNSLAIFPLSLYPLLTFPSPLSLLLPDIFPLRSEEKAGEKIQSLDYL